jgi:hypothetical protein
MGLSKLRASCVHAATSCFRSFSWILADPSRRVVILLIVAATDIVAALVGNSDKATTQRGDSDCSVIGCKLRKNRSDFKKKKFNVLNWFNLTQVLSHIYVYN